MQLKYGKLPPKRRAGMIHLDQFANLSALPWPEPKRG